AHSRHIIVPCNMKKPDFSARHSKTPPPDEPSVFCRANQFAATKAQSPPARSALTGRIQSHRKKCGFVSATPRFGEALQRLSDYKASIFKIFVFLFVYHGSWHDSCFL